MLINDDLCEWGIFVNFSQADDEHKVKRKSVCKKQDGILVKRHCTVNSKWTGLALSRIFRGEVSPMGWRGSGLGRIFLSDANSQSGRPNLLFCKYFCRKLQENETIWTLRGIRVPGTPLYPPMLDVVGPVLWDSLWPAIDQWELCWRAVKMDFCIRRD